MSQIHYTANPNNTPFGLANVNAPGSPYAAAYSRGVTTHLELPVDPKIFDAQPKQFLDLQYLMSYGAIDVPGDEDIWDEQVWSRRPIVVRTTFAGTVASAGNTVTGSIPITAASLERVFVRQKLNYVGSDGVRTQCIVQAITSTGGSEAITVRSMNGAALAPLATGQLLTNGMTVGSDGGQKFSSPSRIATVQRSNLLEKIGPESKIWNEIERKKWKNMQRNDYMQRDMADMLHQLKVSICQRIWFGEYGESINDFADEALITKFTEGIVPAITNNGGSVLSSTMATIWDDFMDAAYATNFMATSNHRIVFGTPETLGRINWKLKGELIRFRPEDTAFDVDFQRWVVPGGMTFDLVPCQIWNDPASFPEDYPNKLVVTQAENIKLVGMKGIPMILQDLVTQSRNNISPSEIYDFERYFCQGFVGTRTVNAAANFIIDITA
jgi:hypothetical protein